MLELTGGLGGVLPNPTRRKVSLAVAALAFLFFCLTLSPAAFPGESASLLAERLGLEPRLAPAHPLWFGVAGFARLLPFGAAPLLLNLSNALFGALAVGLLFHYVAGWVAARIILDQGLTERHACGAALFAGLVAAAAFATGAPLWIASTRFHPLAFHALLLLLAFNLLNGFEVQGGRWRPYALAFVCGAGCAESALFLLMTPFFGARLLVALFRKSRFGRARMTALALALLAGLSLYLVSAWRFAGSEGAALLGDPGVLHTAASQAVEQLHWLWRLLTREGWLWVAFLVAAPWLAVQFEARYGLNKAGDAPSVLFHLLLVIWALAVQFNAGVLPWSDKLPAEPLPVLEALLSAMTLGYAAAFWFLRAVQPVLAREAEGGSQHAALAVASERDARVLRGLAGAVSVALAVLIACAAAKNGACASGRRAAFAHAYVDALVGQLTNGVWLVSDGPLDINVRLAAAQRGLAVNLVSLAAERSPAQLRRLRDAVARDPAFAGQTALYHGALGSGSVVFLQEWLAADTGAVSRVAFHASPELLLEAGYAAVPDRLVVFGGKAVSAADACARLAEQAPFWTRLEGLLAGPAQGDPIDLLRGALRRQVSRTANNLGVLLEDLGRPDEAYAAYLRALALDPDNLSAMLNRVVLTRQGVAPKDTYLAEAAAKKALAKLERRPEAGRLARFYGYVRAPRQFAQQSAEWMRFGQPGLAASALERALSLAPDESHADFQTKLATLYLAQGEIEQAETTLRQVVAQAPSNASAWVGLIRTALHRRDAAAVSQAIEQAQRAGVRPDLLLVERASLDVLNGQPEAAFGKLQSLTDQDPRNLFVWALFANLLLDQGRHQEVERTVLPRMLSAAGNQPNYHVLMTQGFAKRAKGAAFFAGARDDFLGALRLQAGSRTALAEILKLDVALRDRQAAERHARHVLRIDRQDALANYVIGSLLLEQGAPAEAVGHLRRSALAQPTAAVWNDLAEALRQQGALGDAESAARRAVELNAKSPFAHDTLACVLLDAGRLAAAQAACAAARALDPSAVSPMLTDARLRARAGEKVEARELLRLCSAQADRLSPQQRRYLETVSAEAKRR